MRNNMAKYVRNTHLEDFYRNFKVFPSPFKTEKNNQQNVTKKDLMEPFFP